MMKQKKYLIGFLIIAGALIYLLLTTFRSSLQYYVTASELKARTSFYQDKIVKVAGRASGIKKQEGGTYEFLVEEGGASFSVFYKGMTPDTFREGSDVVVTGQLNPDGSFTATEILAKCASKYEAKLKYQRNP